MTNKRIAYFCMEYGLDVAFKNYAGGLGILAGDYMKGAKDHGYPIVGIGVRWQMGYTDQLIEKGHPVDTYEKQEHDELVDTGKTVGVAIDGMTVTLKIWKQEAYGNAPLYLLDADVPGNGPLARITEHLYGGDHKNRIAQEIVLGIGGVRALRALDLDIDVYHFNEGHALFAAFELIEEKRQAGLSLAEATSKTRETVVFTTHTPVVAGNEVHPLHDLKKLGATLTLPDEWLIQKGGKPFNMTKAALRLSRKANAVAQLHGKTANEMWADVEEKDPILAITNAIHRPTWVDERMLDCTSSEKAWDLHMENKRALIDFIEKRNGVRLKEDRLLIGFARRAAPYKRSDLIFRHEGRIGPLLSSGRLQIVFSGKAHPLDREGKAIVARLVKMQQKYPQSVVFLENYDMTIGRMLTRGADVWLNNPRRPMEASGTSGMKAAMNGVLNCSILDGWWPEACRHGINGWQFGDGVESKDKDIADAHDLRALYDVLETEVLPTYYDDPEKWRAMMLASIQDTKDHFAVLRMLEEYDEKLYT